MAYSSSFSSFSELVSEDKYCSGLAQTNNKLNENPEEQNIFTSEFSSADCGEPMYSQQLRIDFTPVPGVDDNDLLEKKCSDFWDFIKRQPQLRNLMVEPKEEEVTAESVSIVSQLSWDISTPPAPAAVHWLKEEVGQPSAFANKPQMKYCDTTSLEEINSIENAPPNSDSIKHRNSENHTKDPLTRMMKKNFQPGVVDLCEQLEDWDRRHPKCMDPPGPVPTLIHATMQRNRE